MFYLTTHSTHFTYGYMASDIMVKDHSDSERGKPLPPHGLLRYTLRMPKHKILEGIVLIHAPLLHLQSGILISAILFLGENYLYAYIH